MLRQPNMDWMLEELATSVPHVRHVVVLSSDGLPIARAGEESEARTNDMIADRLAAVGAGLKSLANSVAADYFPPEGRSIRMVAMEATGGFYYLMEAGEHAYLAVLADAEVDNQLMGNQMRSLVNRVGAHLTTPPRAAGQVT
ncbi:roadblock/LC7 domain-containing protein [Streptomyces meridianus]